METKNLQQKIDEAAHYLQLAINSQEPQILLILGSGLNHVAKLIDDPIEVPFAEVPHLCESTVEGHMGQFVFGHMGGKQVLAMQGRLHGYEGYAAEEVAFPVWVAHKLGASVLFATNAAGAIAKDLAPGDFCVISDHINFMGRNPIANNSAPAMAPRFFSMEGAYDADLRKLALQVASRLNIRAKEGIYIGLLGPSFETPAEIRAYATLGASTVAMSICEEVIAARHVGMRVLGINLITNYAAGLGLAASDGLSFEEELARVFAIAGSNAEYLIEGIISDIE